MASETKIGELLERVKATTGPDRDLDADVWEALVPGVTRKKWSYIHTASGKLCEVDETRDETRRLIIVPNYTSSIDAALALVERVLPGWVPGIDPRHYDDGAVRYRVIFSRSHPERWQPDGSWIERTADEGSAATIPLAILAALLTALSAPEKAGEVET